MREEDMTSSSDKVFALGCAEPVTTEPRANAALVMLARNSDIKGVISSIESLESHFNKWYNYPWLLLNDEPFSEEFKQEVQKHTKYVTFDTIPQEHWEFPESVRQHEFKEWINQQGDRGVLYGNMKSYHQMCRYYLYNFYQHPKVATLEWYWRVEPDVKFFCDITYDPFLEMARNKKKYGFNVLLKDLYYTIPGLYREIHHFMEKNQVRPRDEKLWHLFMVDGHKMELPLGRWDPQRFKGTQHEVREDMRTQLLFRRFQQDDEADTTKFTRLIKEMTRRSEQHPILSEDRISGSEYNWGHFWTNFEISRVDIFTSKIYKELYDHIEESGGFWQERWGDAPVRLLALAMMLNVNELHYFRDIGYQHSDLAHCPINDDGLENGAKVGCRCKCPRRLKDFEDREKQLYQKWRKITNSGFRVPTKTNLDLMERELERQIDGDIRRGAKLHELVRIPDDATEGEPDFREK